MATLALLLAFSAASLTAQALDSSCSTWLRSADFGGPHGDLARLVDLYSPDATRSYMLRRAAGPHRLDVCQAPAVLGSLVRALGTESRAAPVQLLPAELLVVGNSAYPRDWHDGPLWGGRGLNAAVTAGAGFRWNRFSAAVAPVLVWHANAGYDILHQSEDGFSPFIRPWYGTIIDAPQRFGDDAFATLHPGESYARVDVAGFGAGFSTGGMTWGPARRNPLLLSGTAPGFAHIFIETERPQDIRIGSVEFQLFWGRLEESDYFDDDPDNDHRVLAGILFALQPYILDGLHIGAGRMSARTWWPELSATDMLLAPYRGVSANVPGRQGDNQLLTFFFRWAVPRAGFDVYGEWAREDHWGTWVELLRNLDSSQGWTLGFQKVVPSRGNVLRLSAEITHLSDALPVSFAGRGTIPFYSNTAVIQGHTHRGQWLGAPIGTGAEAQAIGADYFWSRGVSSISLERARYDDEGYNSFFAPYYGPHARDSEFSIRAGHLSAFGALAVSADVGWSVRYNRGLLGLSPETDGAYRRDDNLSLRLGGRWNAARGRH